MFMSGLLAAALRSQTPAPTPTPTPTPSTTLNPSDRSSRILLSGGNLIGTMDIGADAHAVGRTIGKIPQVNGNYGFETRPNPQAGSLGGWALTSQDWSNLDKDPSDFWFGKAMAIWPGGQFGSSDTGVVSISPIGGAGATMNGSNWFFTYIRRSGTLGDTVKAFFLGPTGWSSGGDPTAGGGGHDISFFAGKDIYAAAYGNKAGDSCLFNLGGSAFNYAASVGTVTLLA